MTTPASDPKRARQARLKLMLGGLGIAAIALVGLQPWLNSVRKDTERIEQETRRIEAEGSNTQKLQSDLEKAKSAAAASPDDPIAQMRLALAARSIGDLPQALKSATDAARLKPGQPEPLLLQADIHQVQREYSKAWRALHSILAKNPTEPRALRQLGWLYVSLGWTADARPALELGVKAHPEDAQLRVTLALAYLQHNEFGLAEKQVLAVKKLVPSDVNAWIPLVDIYLKSFRYEDALRIAKEGLVLAPSDGRLLVGKGAAEFRLGKTEEALETLQTAYKIDTHHPGIRYHMAMCRQKLGELDEATKVLEALNRDTPGYEQTRLILGRIFLQTGKKDEGRRLIEAFNGERRAMEAREKLGYRLFTNSKDADAHVEMAKVYEAEGNAPRRLAELERALEIDPANQAAKAMLGAAPASGTP